MKNEFVNSVNLHKKYEWNYTFVVNLNSSFINLCVSIEYTKAKRFVSLLCVYRCFFNMLDIIVGNWTALRCDTLEEVRVTCSCQTMAIAFGMLLEVILKQCQKWQCVIWEDRPVLKQTTSKELLTKDQMRCMYQTVSFLPLETQTNSSAYFNPLLAAAALTPITVSQTVKHLPGSTQSYCTYANI